jgi:hypothetical protein
MTDEKDVSLETEHLEEVIETPPPGQPVVVIQYRSRGLPAYVAVPLVVLVAVGSVAVYHRVSFRAARFQAAAAASDEKQPAPEPARPAREPRPGDVTQEAVASPPSAPVEIPTPLALNSQPIAPASLAPAPLAMPEPAAAAKPETKPAAPAAAPAKVDKPQPPADWPPAGTPLRAATSLPPPPPTPVTAAPPAPARGAAAKAVATPAAPPQTPLQGVVPVGFSVPTDPDNPFSELAIARKAPALPRPLDPRPSARDVEPGPAAAPEPLPDRSELMDEIAREAAQKKAEQRQMNDLKEQAREAVDAASLRRIEDDRAKFRQELREIIRTGGRQAGQEIDDLCNRYGRNYDDALRGRVTYLLRHSTGRVSKEARVRQFRAFGVPEPGILDYLANELHHLMNTRGGPRSPDEVRVAAARQLLGIKLDLDSGGGEIHTRSARINPANPSGNRRLP